MKGSVTSNQFPIMIQSYSSRRGEGAASVVGIVAILVIVLLAVYFVFFRGSQASAPSDVNVNLPDTVNVETPNGAR